MTQDTTTEVLAEAWSEHDRYTFQVDGVEYEIAVGDELDYVLPRFLETRYPGEVVGIQMRPQGVGGDDERKCIPTVIVELQIPDGAEHEHLDGKQIRVECYNAPYTLALREDLPAEDFGMIDCFREEGE